MFSLILFHLLSFPLLLVRRPFLSVIDFRKERDYLPREFFPQTESEKEREMERKNIKSQWESAWRAMTKSMNRVALIDPKKYLAIIFYFNKKHKVSNYCPFRWLPLENFF